MRRYEENINTYASLLNWLHGFRRILLVTHERPDGDAISSLFASYSILEILGISAVPYLKNPIPRDYATLVAPSIVIPASLDMNSFDALLCLDAAHPSRLQLPEGCCMKTLDLAIGNIDHHMDNSRYGDHIVLDPSRAATAELLALFSRYCKLSVSPLLATQLLLGMITDTAAFRFANTSSETLDLAAWLMRKGARYQAIIQTVFFNEKAELLPFKAKIFNELRFACDNRLAYFFITPELLQQYGVSQFDTEDLIDSIRIVRGLEIICRFQETDHGVRLSLRSKNPEIAVNRIAHHFDGGGHPLAAGATMRNVSLVEAETLLIKHVEDLLDEKDR